MVRNMQRISLVIIALLLMIPMISCKQPSITTTGDNNPITDGSASWAKGYYSLNEICTAPEIDVIVIGTVTHVAEVVNYSNIPGHPTYGTKFAFKIETTLKGKPGSEIIVNQLGNPDKPGWGIIDDPLYDIGHRYLLFLVQTTEDNPAYVSPGPWGRYEIINEKAYSLNYTKTDSGYCAPAGLDIDGTQIENIKLNIQDILNTTQVAFQDAVRIEPGNIFNIEVAFIAGKYGPGVVTYSVHNVSTGVTQEPFPEGLEVILENARFTAEKGENYINNLQINTSKYLSPGTYIIKLQYVYENYSSGERQLIIYVNYATSGKMGQ